jgi:two-component system, LytTR family, response regulator
MSQDFTCMIVDDEPHAVEFLSSLIGENCPFLKVVATANSSQEAIRQYYVTRPDLIFMDIEVDQMNGFDIINEICGEKHKPHFIFVTGYNRYAVDAFKTNALGYLLKPVDKVDLIKVAERFTGNMESELQQEKMWKFIREYSGKIRFNTSTGFILLHPDEILWCEADHNYTNIHVSIEKMVLVSVNLAVVEDKLPSTGFLRISRSILINEKYLTSVHRRNKTCTLRWQNTEIVLDASAEMLKKL